MEEDIIDLFLSQVNQAYRRQPKAGQIDALAQRAAFLRDRVVEAERLLGEMEYDCGDAVRGCYFCGGTRKGDHKPDCELGIFLHGKPEEAE